MTVLRRDRIRERVVGLQEQCRRLDVTRRPYIFTTPLTRYCFKIRIRWMPVLHVNYQPRILQHIGVAAFEPIIPPAYGFIAPFDSWAEVSVVGKAMVPRSDDGF